MPLINFELDGIEELIEKAELLYGNVDEASEAFLLAYGGAILEKEQQFVRVDTGKTKRALKVSRVKTSRGVKSVWIGDVDKKRGAIPYYLEYGVKKKDGSISKFPFLRPAAYANKNEGINRGKKAFEEMLKQRG